VTAVALSRLAATSTDDGQRKTPFQLENPTAVITPSAIKTFRQTFVHIFPKLLAAGALSQTPLGELTALRQMPLMDLRETGRGGKGLGGE